MKNKKGSRRNRNKGAACREGDTGGGGGNGLCKMRLGKLPDDVLINILEKLDTLDAIRTCILSKRMLKLPTMFSRFNIDIASLVDHHDVASYGFTIRDAVRFNDVVAGVTVKILSERNQEIPISNLKVRFVLMRYYCLSIAKTVARTMAAQKVDNAEFEILTERSCEYCSDADLLYFAKQFNTCFRDCPAAFAGLTRLWLRNMWFDEADIPNILSTCKRLESLRLSYCDAGIHSVLQIEHAQLVELHIDCGLFEVVELNCLPKLQRVRYNNWISYQDPLSFGSVPHLSKLGFANLGVSSTKNFQLSQLLANVPSISDLHLDFESEKIWVLPERPELLAPVLGKLRIVNLVNLPEGRDISWTMFVLEGAPSLKELCITVWDHFWCNVVTNHKRSCCGIANVEWQPSLDFKHKNLVKLTIYGFQPDKNFMRYVRRIMEFAVNMEEISLHDRKVCEGCGDLDPKIKVCPSKYPQTSEEKDMLREEITKDLGVALTSVIHFRS
uniref:F-box domain-containing protein n=1 Tax=Arundo donax TaxID=35708 RepID=A0A0A9C011_ARUDO